MVPRLIINADDLGLTSGVNRAVVELFRAGALSSATLMANGRAFSDAAAITKHLPGLGIGCHVVLVDGVPLCASRDVPTLIGTDGVHLHRSLSSFVRMALLGRLDDADIEREATAQISRLFESGITPTHLDSHKHTHMFPVVLRPLLRVAARFGIPAIRNPFEQAWSLHTGRGRSLRRLQVRLLGLLEHRFRAQMQPYAGRVRTTDGALGVSATGDLDADTLASLIDKLPFGTWELVCHPGFHDQDLDNVATRLRELRDVERKALLAVVRRAVEEKHIELISFLALGIKHPDSAVSPQ